MIRGFSSFLLLNDCKTESEYENIINFLCLLFEMISSARSIAQISAVKMEISIRRAFFLIVLFRTVAHAVFHCPWSFREDIKVVGMVLEDIAKFLLISTGMGFCLGEFIHFEDHFGFFNNPRWCSR